jgi:hypothetical protein
MCREEMKTVTLKASVAGLFHITALTQEVAPTGSFTPSPVLAGHSSSSS